MRQLSFAILGYGSIARVHAAQYKGIRGVRLNALCDIDPDEFAKEKENAGKRGARRLYLSYEEMAEAEKGRIDAIDICLPAYLHAEYSIRAMRDGFNVLVEKPMALSSRDAERMAAVSVETGRTLMTAQCLRFNPYYGLLADAIRDGRWGRLVRLALYRHAGAKRVSLTNKRSWFYDASKSGGFILDIHLHDVDWLLSALGSPTAISCRAMKGLTGGYDEAFCSFRFPTLPGVPVTASGSAMRGCHFTSGFVAIFENAIYELRGSEAELRNKWGETLKMPRVKAKQNMYGAEIAYFAECVRNGVAPERCLPLATAESVRMIERERASAARDGAWITIRD